MNYEMESPWQQLHGKISKKRTRVIWAQNMFGTRFTQLRGKRTTKLTADEHARQSKFKTASEQTNAIMTDIEQLEPYHAAWRNAIKAGNLKYRTLRGYVFSQVYKTL